jgi:hypothetical protein
MGDQKTQLILNLDTGAESDVEELAELTPQLRTELLELDVDTVDLVSVEKAPAKAKAGDPAAWGELLVTLTSSGGVLVALVSLLQSWLTHNERRSVTLEIDGDKLEVTGISSEEQQRLIDAWLSRQTGIVLTND